MEVYNRIEDRYDVVCIAGVEMLSEDLIRAQSKQEAK